MKASRKLVSEVANRIGRHPSTIWRWIARRCNIESEASIQEFLQGNKRRHFYLRASETLRRLDLAVETERRTALEQIPLRQIENVALQISIWMRSALEQFLSSESPGLMAITDLGEFKFLAIEQFRGILHATVKVSIRTNPPIPEWPRRK